MVWPTDAVVYTGLTTRWSGASTRTVVVVDNPKTPAPLALPMMVSVPTVFGGADRARASAHVRGGQQETERGEGRVVLGGAVDEGRRHGQGDRVAGSDGRRRGRDDAVQPCGGGGGRLLRGQDEPGRYGQREGQGPQSGECPSCPDHVCSSCRRGAACLHRP